MADDRMPGMPYFRIARDELTTLLSSVKGTGLSEEECLGVARVTNALYLGLLIRVLTKLEKGANMGELEKFVEDFSRVGVAGVMDEERSE